MTVHYTGGGGGILGSLGKIAQIGSMFVPGMQPWAMAMGAASALANGDPAGAVANVVMPQLMNKIGGAATGAGAAPAQAAPAQAAPVTATGNPMGGVSAVSNAGAQAPQGASIMNSLADIVSDPSAEAARRMYSSSPGNWGGVGISNPTDGMNAWTREYYKNQRRY
jgi:hypothetical protein